ncbi:MULTISPECIES: DUF3046 domain-containing protein [unclassified Arthrobacter]|uniref:DUF3046 domain-containing protein n=1 Tax=unclassified Arthrobacter TaxID=235627 RepID=UPI001037C7BE|nr:MULTISPECIES: DUF3046 domain-containing protein [unclassified Arthrobacter]MDR7160209.1 hypothetical protein [Arthrobacter sp. BE255]TAP44230.1 DUF3046 domain-containing protein [Arthrobacter sp. S39]
MRISDYWRLMDDEFGSGYSRVVSGSLILAGVGGRTADQALAAGVSPRQVWLAVCDVQDVPPERRLGRDIKPLRD